LACNSVQGHLNPYSLQFSLQFEDSDERHFNFPRSITFHQGVPLFTHMGPSSGTQRREFGICHSTHKTPLLHSQLVLQVPLNVSMSAIEIYRQSACRDCLRPCPCSVSSWDNRGATSESTPDVEFLRCLGKRNIIKDNDSVPRLQCESSSLRSLPIPIVEVQQSLQSRAWGDLGESGVRVEICVLRLLKESIHSLLPDH